MAQQYTIANTLSHEIEPIKGSRFVATIGQAPSAEDGQALVDACRARWPKANHHAFAWRAGFISIDPRCSDDGEPKGTAGMPILRVLEGRGLICTVVVVTRWFGGTKLGTGGLARAYSLAASQALDLAGTTGIETRLMFMVEVPHALSGAAYRVFERHRISLTVMSADEAAMTLKLTIPGGLVDQIRHELREASSGRLTLPK